MLPFLWEQTVLLPTHRSSPRVILSAETVLAEIIISAETVETMAVLEETGSITMLPPDRTASREAILVNLVLQEKTKIFRSDMH